MWTGLIVLGAACLASRLNLSYRHFSVPLVLLILLLAALPPMLRRVSRPRLLVPLTAALAIASLYTAARPFPYFMPYVNALAFGHPAYELMNDSNVDWNQSLPEVRRFAESHRIAQINVDFYGMTDPSPALPRARIWNCQTPEPADAGQWVVVSANMILDSHNCIWLMQYPKEALAGGSMYAVRLPAAIPPAGFPGGPPVASEQHQMFGAPSGMDPRTMSVDVIRHPETMPQMIAKMKAEMDKAMAKR